MGPPTRFVHVLETRHCVGHSWVGNGGNADSRERRPMFAQHRGKSDRLRAHVVGVDSGLSSDETGLKRSKSVGVGPNLTKVGAASPKIGQVFPDSAKFRPSLGKVRSIWDLLRTMSAEYDRNRHTRSRLRPALGRVRPNLERFDQIPLNLADIDKT